MVGLQATRARARRGDWHRILHLLTIGVAAGLVIACLAPTERRDSILLARQAEIDAMNGMVIVEQAAGAAEDYRALSRRHFDAAVARARPGQRMAERIGMWLASRGQSELAVPYLMQALRRNPRYELALVAASSSSAVGDTDATTEAYATAIRLNPSSPVAYNNLAYYFAVRGIRLFEAERLARMALERTKPGSLEASSYWDTLAWVLYKQGRFAEAREAMARVDPLFHSDPIVREHIEAIEEALRGHGGQPEAPEANKEEPGSPPEEPSP